MMEHSPNKAYPTLTQSLPCLAWGYLVHGKKFHETHLHLSLSVLEMKDFPFCEWHAFLAAPLLTGSKLLPSSYFHACYQPVSTYFSYLSNRWEFGDELYLVSQSAQTQEQSYYHRQRSPQICFIWP